MADCFVLDYLKPFYQLSYCTLLIFSSYYVYYISCIYTCRFWNVLTLLSNVILSNIHIIPILLLILLQIILYIYLHTLGCIYCIINCNIVPYSYFPHVSLHILYIQLQTVKFISKYPSQRPTFLSMNNSQYTLLRR